MAQDDKIEEMIEVVNRHEEKISEITTILKETLNVIKGILDEDKITNESINNAFYQQRISDQNIAHALAVGEANADELKSLDVQREWPSEFDHEKEVAELRKKITEIMVEHTPDKEAEIRESMKFIPEDE